MISINKDKPWLEAYKTHLMNQVHEANNCDEYILVSDYTLSRAIEILDKCDEKSIPTIIVRLDGEIVIKLTDLSGDLKYIIDSTGKVIIYHNKVKIGELRNE